MALLRGACLNSVREKSVAVFHLRLDSGAFNLGKSKPLELLSLKKELALAYVDLFYGFEISGRPPRMPVLPLTEVG